MMVSEAESSQSQPATDSRLEITLGIKSGVVGSRAPMRTAILRFRNVGTDPVRFYLPRPEDFRLLISTLRFQSETDDVLLVPGPHPHGYVVTEQDFHLIEPGRVVEFTQSFCLDPIAPGGKRTERRAGFERGRRVAVCWMYENSIRRWEGGRLTLDGPTRTLFAGQDIPWIWTGKLQVQLCWTVPD